MCCCAGNALCWAGQACCSCLCSACSACGIKSKVFSKIGYVVLSIFWTWVGLLMLFVVKDIFNSWFLDFIHCPENNKAWFGMSAVFRISFILVLFHLLVFLVCLMRNQFAAVFHDGWWSFKFMIVLVAYIVSFFINNDFFKGYVIFAKVISVFFLIYQGLTMLSLSYILNKVAVEYWENTNSNFIAIVILIVTIVIYILDGIFIIFQFIWFKDCGVNIVILWIVIFFAIVFTLLVIFKTREDSSILTNAFVISYALYLSWSAMASGPNDSWNLNNNNSLILYQILLGLLFTLITVFDVVLSLP